MRRRDVARRDSPFEDRLSDTFRAVGEQTQADAELLSEVADLREATSSSLAHFRPDLDDASSSGQEPIDGIGFNIVTMDAVHENALL